jgi:DNA repair exonuclease SbcCD nuclease subunit
MKVAILCDSHFGCRSDSKIFLKHQRRFFEEVFFPALSENGVDTVLHLGDVFDRRKYINFNTLQESKEFFFEPLRDQGITVHTILGNHDTFFTTTNEVNSLRLLLSEYTNINIYENDPVELVFGPTNVIMCPWLVKDTYQSALTKIKESSASILLGHFDIKGFEMMKGVLSSHGIDHKEFNQFESVFSGHYHYPSHYGNIRYLGTQYEMSWSDYGVDHGFYLLDTDTKDLEFIQNPNKIYHKIDYDDTDLTIEEVSELDTSSLQDCFVKVIVKNRTNPYIYDMFLDKLNDSGAADVKSVEDKLNLDTLGEDAENMIEEAKGTKDIMHLYIDAVDTKTDKNEIKYLVDQLYQEAINAHTV